jgi:SSS family solute:Na+ symporter
VPAGFATIDWIIVFAYAAMTLGLGWYFGRRQSSVREYFSGSGQMNPILIGVSLFASLLSTVTYLSLPGEMIGKGPIYLTNFLSYPIVFLIVGYVLLPVYMEQRVTSAYELLEERLGVGTRVLGASMFILLRLVWMSLLIYAAARAFSYIIDVDEKWVPLIVIVTGSISLVYASLGGLRAVVVTDLIQTILLYGGAVLVIFVVSVSMGGFAWFPTEWNADWDTQPFFTIDPETRVTIVGSFVSMLIWFVATSGGDQVSIQRFMATKDAQTARKAFGLQLILGAVVGITLGVAGFAMLGYFQANPEMLSQGMSLQDGADNIFPRFIAFHLPPVASGLVASGMLAAAMSSMDSGINSISAVVSTDFVGRFRESTLDENGHVRLARWLAAGVGVVVLVGSMLIERVPGNILAVTNKTVNLFTVPIFCLFFFALFVPRSTRTGVWLGFAASTAVGALVAFSGPLVTMGVTKWGWHASTFGIEMITTVDPATGRSTTFAPDPISFQWISTISLVVNLLVGWVASVATAGRRVGGQTSN